MKLGIVGTGQVGCAIALAAVTRGSAREIVLVNRTRKTAEAVATDIRYGAPLWRWLSSSDCFAKLTAICLASSTIRKPMSHRVRVGYRVARPVA